MIVFSVPGDAVPQARPRFVRTGAYQRPYDPKKNKQYKKLVGDEARKVMSGELISGPVMIYITVHRSIPVSWNAHKKTRARRCELYPTSRPDLDNLVKGIKDALKGIVWHDDSQVVTLNAKKLYSDFPRVEIQVWDMDNDSRSLASF